MNIKRNRKKKKLNNMCVKHISLLTLIVTNFLVVSTSEAAYPFYPVPAYLSTKAETIKPNVMLMVDSSGSMDFNYINGVSRINIAKKAFSDLVRDNPDLVRWGFSSFHVVDFVPIADNNANRVLDQIPRVISPSGTPTPTMPVYYQLIRYFQGLNPTGITPTYQYLLGNWANRKNDATTRPPFQYRCQKNFIISLSDGGATNAAEASEFAGDSVFSTLPRGNLALPSYTGKAFTHDFKTSGVDAEGGSWDDPNYPLQNIITYTIGFGSGVGAADIANLQQAADAGGGKYYTAGDSAALVASLKDALDSITSIVRSPSPPAYISTAKSAGSVSVKFNSSNWSSELVAYAGNTDGSINQSITKPVTYPTGTNRNIWFNSPTNGIVALKANSSTDTAAAFGVAASESSSVISWLQGSAVATIEKRASVLGDVINSEINVVNNGALFSLSANDGMVHVFKRNAVGGYAEVFAYIPSLAKRESSGTLAKEIPALTKSNYGKTSNVHRYLVDGGSFYRGVEGDNKHIVVGATGRGAAGIYALDMQHINTNPSNGNKDSVIFDITNNGVANGFRNLGYTVGSPVIVKVNDGGISKLVALVSNGYYSKNISPTGAQGLPVLYAINLEAPSKGMVWRDFIVNINSQVGSDAKNGLSSPTAVDVDNDGYAEYAYAGDLKGNLYRFDLRSDISKGFNADSDHIVKIFSGSLSQPITSAPAVYKRKDGKLTVIFGTGSLLEEADNNSKTQQAVYGIIDDLSVTGGLTADTEQPVQASELASQAVVDSGNIRMLTTNNLDAADKGWKLNLSSGSGERVIYQPVVYGHTVFLTTQIVVPPDDGLLCASSSGGGYEMSLDAETGGMPKASNAHFTGATSTNYVAGNKITTGFPSKVGGLTPTILNQNGTNVDGQISSGMIFSSIALPNPKDPSYAGGVYGADGREQTYMTVTTNDGTIQTGVTGAQPDKGKNNVRIISWREIF